METTTDTPFSITVVEVGGFRQLCLIGELTTATLDSFNRAVRDTLSADTTSVAIDLRLVQRVDAEGLESLQAAAQALRSGSLHVTVVGPMRGQAMRVTELSGTMQTLRPPVSARRCLPTRSAGYGGSAA